VLALHGDPEAVVGGSTLASRTARAFESRTFGRQFRDLDFTNADFAPGVVLLEGKVPLLEGLGEVQIFIQLIAVDRDLDARH